MTYKEAFDKITEAYIKGEIKPLDPQFCFCGTLCNGAWGWYKMNKSNYNQAHNNYKEYTGEEYRRMEKTLFDGMYSRGVYNLINSTHPNYEEALFGGMCDALEVLKQIHADKGEIIDEEFVFEKRILNEA